MNLPAEKKETQGREEQTRGCQVGGGGSGWEWEGLEVWGQQYCIWNG